QWTANQTRDASEKVNAAVLTIAFKMATGSGKDGLGKLPSRYDEPRRKKQKKVRFVLAQSTL
ncbi:MAG: hypothetical protein ACYTBJ_16555, partial [Planctomycetota bacterium]